jgi:hypothetical protein
MTIFLDENENRNPLAEQNWAKGERTSFTENAKAAWNFMSKSEVSTAKNQNLYDAYGDVVSLLAENGHTNFVNPLEEDTISTFAETNIDGFVSKKNRLSDFHLQIDKLTNENPEIGSILDANSLRTPDQIAKKISIDAKNALQEFQDINERATGAGKFGGFAGIAGRAMVDPLVLSTVPIGFMYSTPKTFLGAAWKIGKIESILAAASETGVQVISQKYRKDLGFDDAGFVTGAKNVGYAFAGGALLGPAFLGAGKGAIKGVKLSAQGYNFLKNKLQQLPNKTINDIYSKAVNTNPKYKNEKIPEADTKEVLTDDNPLVETQAAKLEHEQRIDTAARSIVDEQPPKILDEKPVNPIKTDELYKTDNIFIKTFDPEEIEFDAQTFQYKTDGDVRGVSDKLQNVTEWDQPSAGTVLVFEFRDGRKAIVDGHQRLGLAKRLKKQGQKTKLLAHVFKEADGHTPEDALLSGLMINLRNNTGTATDAARVLRKNFNINVENLKKSIPTRLKLFQNAVGLKNLSDDAWGFYLSGKVDEDLAAMIGEVITNKAIHKDVMGALYQRKFNTKGEMQSALEQINNLPTVKTTTDSLFGTEELEEALILERASLLDYASRNLKKIKSIFKTASEGDTTLQKAGNVLNKARNEKEVIESGKIIDKINTIANRVGTLSDDLNNAAKIFKQGKKSEGQKLFLEAIERANQRGDFDGISSSRPIASNDAPIETPAVSKQQTEPEDISVPQKFVDPHNDTKIFEDEVQNIDQTITDTLPDNTEIPTGIRLDENTGEEIIETTTKKDLLDEEKQLDETLERLKDCQ